MTSTLTPDTGTFSTSRRELSGPDTMLGPAEPARRVCREPERRLSLLSVTPERMRRVDAWIAADSIVTHAASPDVEQSVVGSISPLGSADALVGSILESLVGPLPPAPAESAIDVGPVSAIAPGPAFPGTRWILVVTAETALETVHLMLSATGTGLVGGQIVELDAPTRLEPMAVLNAWIAVGKLIGPTAVKTDGTPTTPPV